MLGSARSSHNMLPRGDSKIHPFFLKPKKEPVIQHMVIVEQDVPNKNTRVEKDWGEKQDNNAPTQRLLNGADVSSD